MTHVGKACESAAVVEWDRVAAERAHGRTCRIASQEALEGVARARVSQKSSDAKRTRRSLVLHMAGRRGRARHPRCSSFATTTTSLPDVPNWTVWRTRKKIVEGDWHLFAISRSTEPSTGRSGGNGGGEPGTTRTVMRSRGPRVRSRRPGGRARFPCRRTRRHQAGTRLPFVDSRLQEVGSRRPMTDTRRPRVGTRRPLAGSQRPGGDTRRPRMGARLPGGATGGTQVRTQLPFAGTRRPPVGTRPRIPDAPRHRAATHLPPGGIDRPKVRTHRPQAHTDRHQVCASRHERRL
jgi:hypothetical protein